MADFASLEGKDGASPPGPRPMPGTWIAVISDRDKVKGLRKLEDASSCSPIAVVPVAEAFTREWPTDAHCVLYLSTEWRIGDPFYRLNKPVLSAIRLASAKAGEPEDIHVFFAAIDLDTKDHKPWNAETWSAFMALLASVKSTPIGEILDKAIVSYSTRKGWRWIFCWTRGLPADDAEIKLRGLVKILRDHGLPVDAAEVLATWNCSFRLPRVMRDGTRSSDDPFFYCSPVYADRRLDPESIPSVGEIDKSESYYEGDASRPTQEESQALLHYTNDRGNVCDTLFYKEMKKAGQGRDWFNAAFDLAHPFPVEKSHRHETMRRWTLSAAGFAVQIEGATEQHLYALFEPVASAVDANEPGRDFRHDTWRLCTGAWGKVVGQFVQEKKEQAKHAEEVKIAQATGEETIIKGVRAWHPRLATDPVAAWAWIKSRMILKEKRRGNYYVMDLNGNYFREPVDETGLLAQIKQQGMDVFVPLTRETKSGSRPMKVSDLSVEGFLSNVSSVEYRPEIEGGYIEDANDAFRQKLVLLSFRRNRKLVPEYNPFVDEWLRVFGDWQYNHLCFHLGAFLAWEMGPCAAMAFNHSPTSGKGMLAQGLIETLENYKQHVAATADDLVMQFNDSLKNTPFIFLNEGLQNNSHAHPSDMFRRVVTGDYFRAEGKNKDSIAFKFPFRVMVTANHTRIMDALGEGRDLSPHERDALGIRIVEYSPRDKTAAARFLASKGGRAWTKGWIEDESGESKFILAKHLLWLHQEFVKNASVPRGTGRLLVEGSPHQEAIQRLRVQGGSTPMVMETIIKLMNTQSPGGRPAFKIENHRLYVTVGGILDYWRNNLTKGTGERLTAKRVDLALAGLVTPDGGMVRFKNERGQEDPTEWHEIDVVTLSSQAAKYGWSCKKLDDLLQVRIDAVTSSAQAPSNVIALPYHAS